MLALPFDVCGLGPVWQHGGYIAISDNVQLEDLKGSSPAMLQE